MKLLGIIKDAKNEIARHIEIYRIEKIYKEYLDRWKYHELNYHDLLQYKEGVGVNKKHLKEYDRKFKEITEKQRILKEIIDKSKLLEIEVDIRLLNGEVCYYKGQLFYTFYDASLNDYFSTPGRLYITSRRIIFISDSTITYYLDKVIDYKILPDEIYFRTENEKSLKLFSYNEKKLDADYGFDFACMRAILRSLLK